MKNRRKGRLYLYIVVYGIAISGKPKNILSSGKIYAPNDDKALDMAEEKRSILNTIENIVSNPAPESEVVLLSLRKTGSKRIIYSFRCKQSRLQQI